MDVFTSKGKPLVFYVFPGSHREFLVFLIQSAGGKISSSLNEDTINIAGRMADIPSDVKFDVLGVDYITTSLKMKCALYPANFVLCKRYNYAPSLIQDFKSFVGSFHKKSPGKSHTNNVCRTREEENSTRIHETHGERSSCMNSSDLATDISRVARGDCVVRTTTRSDDDMRRPTETGSLVKTQPFPNRERDISMDRAGIVSKKTKREKNERTRDKTKCSSSVNDEDTNVNGRFKSNTQQNKVSRIMDTRTKQSSKTIKESTQSPIVIDLIDGNPTSEPSSDGSVRDAHSPLPTQREKRLLPLYHGTHAVEMSESDAEFREESRGHYKSVFNEKKEARCPYSKKEQILILSFIKDRDLYSRTKGRYIWKYMEKKDVVSGRSWQSMAEHFRKKILPNVETFGDILSRKEIVNFKRILNPNYENTDTISDSREKKLDDYFPKRSKTEQPREYETGGSKTSAPAAPPRRRRSDSSAESHSREPSHYDSRRSERSSGFGTYLEQLIQE